MLFPVPLLLTSYLTSNNDNKVIEKNIDISNKLDQNSNRIKSSKFTKELSKEEKESLVTNRPSLTPKKEDDVDFCDLKFESTPDSSVLTNSDTSKDGTLSDDSKNLENKEVSNKSNKTKKNAKTIRRRASSDSQRRKQFSSRISFS